MNKLNRLHESVCKENYKDTSKLGKVMLDQLNKGKSVKEILDWLKLLNNAGVIPGVAYNSALAAINAYKKKDMKGFKESVDLSKFFNNAPDSSFLEKEAKDLGVKLTGKIVSDKKLIRDAIDNLPVQKKIEFTKKYRIKYIPEPNDFDSKVMKKIASAYKSGRIDGSTLNSFLSILSSANVINNTEVNLMNLLMRNIKK